MKDILAVVGHSAVGSREDSKKWPWEVLPLTRRNLKLFDFELKCYNKYMTNQNQILKWHVSSISFDQSRLSDSEFGDYFIFTCWKSILVLLNSYPMLVLL